MAHSLSAKKRIKQNEKRRAINKARKSEVRTRIKSFEAAVKSGDKDAAGEQLKLVTRKLDKVAATSTMHKNTAARLKSRLTKKLNKLEA